LEISQPFWIMRDHIKCSGCRRCEIACSLKHEGKIWPEASRIRIFMLFPGLEVAHLCSQCEDPECVKSCSVEALSINHELKCINVNNEKCIACGNCIKSCPGHIPTIHPTKKHIIICDLCEGDPECVKACQETRFNCLYIVPREPASQYCLFAQTPEEVTKNLAISLFGEKGKDLI
jgi:Fe-S-cluster-containing hydrogenase component 2